MGGRLSLEAHSAKLRGRHQVQAELRAWCEEVLEGQQQQQVAQADEQHSPGAKSTAARKYVMGCCPVNCWLVGFKQKLFTAASQSVLPGSSCMACNKSCGPTGALQQTQVV
jgi:hypothetical protein